MIKNRLQEIIEKEGVTQASLARQIKKSKELINKVCRKKHNPSKTTKNLIIKGLIEIIGKNYKLEDVFLDKSA